MQHTPDRAAVAQSPCTCFKVRSLARRVTQLYDDTLAPSGLRITQFSLLERARRLGRDAPPTVSALAAALFTDRTTLTRNLRPLIASGLVALQPGPDARSKAVVVTAEGERTLLHARELWKLAQKRVRRIGGVDEIARLEGMIEGVLARFDDGGAA